MNIKDADKSQSLFAMPLFDWDAEHGASVFSGRFWIYWVITVPLTILVMILWVIWIRRKSLRHAREDDAAGIRSNALSPKVDGTGQQETQLGTDANEYRLNSFAIGRSSRKNK